jgi:hypothetical protein
MDAIDFDERLSELITRMVELAFDYVERDTAQVDALYIFGSMESDGYYYNVCYRINGKLVKKNKVNSVSEKKFDDSGSKMIGLMKKGVEVLRETAALFKEARREVPTLMKMDFHPKTGKFNNDIGYDEYYTAKEITIDDVFTEWFSELESKHA